MPATEPQPSDAFGTGPAQVTPLMVEMLRQTRPWVNFLSVLGFVGTALLLLTGAATLVLGVASARPKAAILGALYLPASVLYFFAALFLFQYAKSIGEFVRGGQPGQMESALKAQKSFWKFIGVVALLWMCFAALLLLFILGGNLIRTLRG